jgi:hypothetical protein
MIKALEKILIPLGRAKPKAKALKIIYAVWQGDKGSGPQYIMAALWPVGADKPIHVAKLDGYKRLGGETKEEADAIIDKIAKGEDGISGEYVRHGFFEEVSLADVPSDGRTEKTKSDDGQDEAIDRSTAETHGQDGREASTKGSSPPPSTSAPSRRGKPQPPSSTFPRSTPTPSARSSDSAESFATAARSRCFEGMAA